MLTADQIAWYDRRLTRAVELIYACDDQSAQVWFSTHDTNFRFACLYFQDWGKHYGLSLMIPRGPEMKPHYAAFRDWFAAHDLDWVERTVDGRRYMSAQIWGPPYVLAKSGETDGVAAVLRTVKSLAADVFETHIIRVTTENLNIRFGMEQTSMVGVMGIMLFIGAFCIIIVSQISRLFPPAMPSWDNITTQEATLLACLYFGVILLRLTFFSKVDYYPDESRKRWNVQRMFKLLLFFSAPLLLMAMTLP